MSNTKVGAFNWLVHTRVMVLYCNRHEVAQEPYLNIEIFKNYILRQKRFNGTIQQTFKGHHLKRVVHQQWRGSNSCSSLRDKATNICSLSSTRHHWHVFLKKQMNWLNYFWKCDKQVFHSMQELFNQSPLVFLPKKTSNAK